MKCYAERLGDCSGSISREHYISKSVLDIAGKAVRISGFPWQKLDQKELIGNNSLTANILCKYHNSQLSSLDQNGNKFVSSLKKIYSQALQGDSFLDEVFTINGTDFELWLLKILCGFFAIIGKYEIPDKWINLLFKRETFPNNFGLYIFGEPGNTIWYFNLVRVISVKDTNNNIAGAKFGIGGIPFLLAFGKPTFHEKGFDHIYRPQSIKFNKSGKTKEINFIWPNESKTGSISLTFPNFVENTNQYPRLMVSPD